MAFPARPIDFGSQCGRTAAKDAARVSARFERTVRLWPSFSSAWYEIGKILAAPDRPDEAADALRRAIEVNPRHAEAWSELGDLLFETGRFDSARDAYGRAVSLGRDDVRPRLERARRRAASAGSDDASE